MLFIGDRWVVSVVIKIAVVCALVATGTAYAQTACPGGVAAGSAQCGPSPANHNTTPMAPGQSNVRYFPTGVWKDSWGAIFVDSKVGSVGVSTDMPSATHAKKDALERCSKSGATDCEFLRTFRNQCVVLAWPRRIGGKVVSYNEKTIEEATKIALNVCMNDSGEACDIVYSTCVEPIFESY